MKNISSENRGTKVLPYKSSSAGQRNDPEKGTMPGWERRLLDLCEKHMLLLSLLLISLLALYLRKVAVWWNHENVLAHFDRHSNHTESSFYYLLIKAAEYLPLLPLHSIKWLGGLSDFALAFVCAKIAGGKSRLKQSIVYMLCLFSPVVFLRGIVWAQPDSAALFLLLTAYLLYENYGKAKSRSVACLCILLAGTGIAITPCLLVIFLIYTASHAGYQKQRGPIITSVIAVTILLQTVSALLLTEHWTEGFVSALRFGTYHPLTGSLFESPEEWLIQMLILFGLPGSVISFLYAARSTATGPSRRFALFTALGCQFLVTLLYSSRLFS